MSSSRTTLFDTVPSHDYLQFWQAGRFQPQRVVRFLGLSKEEVAQLAEVAVSSVRFDRRAPHELIECLTEVAATCTLVAQFFEGNAIKTALWFKSVNPVLDDVAPRDLIRRGDRERLRRFVLDAMAASAPDR